jgi:hypothetical protein
LIYWYIHSIGSVQTMQDQHEIIIPVHLTVGVVGIVVIVAVVQLEIRTHMNHRAAISYMMYIYV